VIADTGNNRLRIVVPDANHSVFTLAGSGTGGYVCGMYKATNTPHSCANNDSDPVQVMGAWPRQPASLSRLDWL
jgi:hypothetical protein